MLKTFASINPYFSLPLLHLPYSCERKGELVKGRLSLLHRGAHLSTTLGKGLHGEGVVGPLASPGSHILHAHWHRQCARLPRVGQAPKVLEDSAAGE